MKPTLSFIATACLIAAWATSAAQAADMAHWGYQGHGNPAHWAELEPDSKTCKLGKLQSPINIETKKVEKSAEAKAIGVGYTAGSGGEVVDNGHTIQAAFKERYAMNARPVQPLHGRKVVLSQ